MMMVGWMHGCMDDGMCVMFGVMLCVIVCVMSCGDIVCDDV